MAVSKIAAASQRIKTIFAEALGQIKPVPISSGATEIDAVDKAIDMETRSYDYYKSQAKRAAGAEMEFYEAVAAEEQVHHLVLLDYKEFLNNPAAWFVKAEHPSFDGA